MLNIHGPRCQLRVNWSKKEDDIVYKYPKGSQTKSDAMLLHSVFSKEFLDDLVDRGYDLKTLKFSVAIDWNKTTAKEKFSELWHRIRELIPQSYNQMSFGFIDVENETLRRQDA